MVDFLGDRLTTKVLVFICPFYVTSLFSRGRTRNWQGVPYNHYLLS